MCGIAAINFDGSQHKENELVGYLYKMLIQLQNRGQLSAGITTFNKNRVQLIDTQKSTGYVNEVFKLSHEAERNHIIERYAGTKGIGHVRYATCGCDAKSYAQPFERHHGRIWKWFSFAFNGNLANFPELKQKLAADNYHLVRNTDTEIIMHFISKQFIGDARKDLIDAFSALPQEFDGAYNLVFLNAEGQLAALRDPLGIHPLEYGSIDGMFAAASESASLNIIGIDNHVSLAPGEMLLSNNGSFEKKRFAKCNKRAHCMFEWVYFANVASEIDNVSVYEARWRLGKELAKAETKKIDSDSIVVGVPDTAKPAADSFALELGIPSQEGLIRNRYVGRTFIEGGERTEKVRNKFILNKPVLKGKKVFLIEDSIVRGTTTQALVEEIKTIGKAKEVHVRVSCPPVRYPCFYGIDMSTFSELTAANCSSEQELKQKTEFSEKNNDCVCKRIHADSLNYQTMLGLENGIGKSTKELCTACLTGQYPTPWGEKLLQTAMENFKDGKCHRTYE
jgi:amidophosphoribosyltransferase